MLDPHALILIIKRSLPLLDPVAWLYAARGFYRLGQYHNAVEALASCLRHEPTRKEAQHLLSFCLMHLGQMDSAAHGFVKSVECGNESDWYPPYPFHGHLVSRYSPTETVMSSFGCFFIKVVALALTCVGNP